MENHDLKIVFIVASVKQEALENENDKEILQYTMKHQIQNRIRTDNQWIDKLDEYSILFSKWGKKDQIIKIVRQMINIGKKDSVYIISYGNNVLVKFILKQI